MSRYSRNAVLFTTLMLLLALAAWSQTDDPKKTYTLAGTVMNSVTGKPIARVLVQLEPSSRALLTGPDGSFSFDNVSAGRAEIHLTKPGYFRSSAPHAQYAAYMVMSMPFPVEVGPETGKVVLKLTPTATITGTVQGNDDEPIEGVQISVLALRVNEGRRELQSEGRDATTDEDGNFRISGLVPGQYYVRANASWASRVILGAQSDNGGEAYPASVYFPASTDIAGAERLDLTGGQHKEVHFVLKTVPSFRIAGVVSRPDGWKLNPPVFVDDMQQPILTVNRFDPQGGAFEFRGVPAANYFLLISGMDAQGGYSVNYQRFAVHSNLAGLRLALQPGFDIPIIEHVDFLHKEAVRGHCTSMGKSGETHESDCSDYPSIRLELHSLDFGQIQFNSDYGPLKGKPSLRGVMPGRYNVRAMPMFGGYVQSVRSGGVDLLHEPLVVPEDGNVDPIEVVLRDDGATLKIKIRDAKLSQPTLVLVFPDSLGTVQPQSTATTLADEVYLGPVPPGAYKVFAFDSVEQVNYASGEELAKYAEQATSVRVGANDNASVVVDLIHIGE